MLPLTKLVVLFALSIVFLRAETPAPAPRYWHLVNSAFVLRIDSVGQLTFLNTGESGQLTFASDHTFTGTFADAPVEGKFAEDKLWLRRTGEPTPAALAYLECRPIDEPTARDLVRYSRAAHTRFAGDIPRALRTSIANALRQRLELLAESVMFHCLENNLTKVAALSDLIGPEKQLSALPSIDGEDYTQLDLTPNATWTIETASGIKVTHPQ